MNLLLYWFGSLCIAVGVVFMATDLIQAFVRLSLNRQAPLGMGVLMVTVGLIAIQLGRDKG